MTGCKITFVTVPGSETIDRCGASTVVMWACALMYASATPLGTPGKGTTLRFAGTAHDPGWDASSCAMVWCRAASHPLSLRLEPGEGYP